MGGVDTSFLRPLPLGTREDILKSLADGSSNFGTATLAVYRPMSVGLCVVWFWYLVDLYFHMQERIATSGRWHMFVFWGILVVFALLTVASRIVDKQRFYRLTFLAVGVAYSVLLGIHALWEWTTGSSPLIDLCLGDFVGIPAIMLATAIRKRAVIAYVMGMAAVSAMTNYNLVGGTSFDIALGAANSMFSLAAFIVFLNYGMDATMAVDRLAARSLKLTIRSGQRAMLQEFRTRFMGYLHDEVLTYLHAVSRGVATPKDRKELLDRTRRLGTDSGLISLSTAYQGWVGAMRSIDPSVRLTFPPTVGAGLMIPTNVAATMLEAAMEALTNCVEHAPHVAHRVSIEVTEYGGCRVTIADDGPGFDIGDVAHDRAGVRVAIVGRMVALNGGSAEITSSPGEGTTVVLRWENEGSTPSTRPLVPSAFEMLGVRNLLTPFSFVLVLGFMVLLSVSAWPFTKWGLYALVFAALTVALVAMFQGSNYFLEPRWTALAAIAIAVFITLAPFSMSEHTARWPFAWYVWAFGLLCTWLRMRGRAVVAWVVALYGAAVYLGLGASGVLSYELRPQWMFSVFPLIVAASLIPTLTRKATAQVPALWATYSDDQMSSGLALARATFIEQAGRWIADQIAALEKAPDPVETSRLLERRIRDCIRCPLFDDPETTRAAWQARSRGATVTLLDDRQAVDGAGAAHEQLLVSLRECLDQLEAGGTLTARINPAGRQRFATIVWQPRADAEVERKYV